MSTRTKPPNKTQLPNDGFSRELRAEIKKMNPEERKLLREKIELIKQGRPKTVSGKKFVPVTHAECNAYCIQFREWLRAQGGKEADRAFSNIEWLQIAANYEVTERAQRDVTRARNQLNKFFRGKK